MRTRTSVLGVGLLALCSCSGIVDDPAEGDEVRGTSSDDRPTAVICMSQRSADFLVWRRLQLESGGCSDEYIQTTTGVVTKQVAGVPCTCPKSPSQKPRCVFEQDQGWLKPKLVIMRYDDGGGFCIDKRINPYTGVGILWPAESCACPAAPSPAEPPAQPPAEPPAQPPEPPAAEPEPAPAPEAPPPTCYCDELCVENGDCCSDCG